MSGPLRISPETAVKLSKQLGVPIEHLMHMPRHILMQRMAELAAKEAADSGDTDHNGSKDGAGAERDPGQGGQS